MRNCIDEVEPAYALFYDELDTLYWVEIRRVCCMDETAHVVPLSV
jgi:hypothetical protein